MFFCRGHYLCLPPSTYNTQSFIRDTELLKCKEEKLKEGIFLPKQGKNENGTVTFCVCAALMRNSNCSILTDSKINQILMMPPFLMVAYKDLRLWILILHIPELTNWHVPARTAPAVTLRRHFLSLLVDLEDPTGTHPWLPSCSGIRQELKRGCSAFSHSFVLLFHGNFQFGSSPDDKLQAAPMPAWTPVLGVGPREFLWCWQEVPWVPWDDVSGEGMQRGWWSQTPSYSPRLRKMAKELHWVALLPQGDGL